MNLPFKDWIDFGVKAVIVVVAVYLAMGLFFKADVKHMSQVSQSLQNQVERVDKQTQFLTSITMNNNADALYHMALEDEARGDIPSAVKKLTMAIQLSEYHAQQCRIKLSQMIPQGSK